MSSNAQKRTVLVSYIRFKRYAHCYVHWCVTVFYQQIANGNIANQIHEFTIDYSKFILKTNSNQLYFITTKRDKVLWYNKQTIVLIFINCLSKAPMKKSITLTQPWLNLKCTLFYTFIWSHKNHVFTLLLTILKPHPLTLPGKSLWEIR